MNIYKIRFQVLLLFIFTALMLAGVTSYVVAQQEEVKKQSQDEIRKQYEDTRNEIDKLQRQVDILHSKERTLANQIDLFSTQIQSTTLQIQRTQDEIDQLLADITVLQGQIDGLEISLERVSNQIAERAVNTYQRGNLSVAQLVLMKNGFEDLVTKYAYLSYVQEYDKRILVQLQFDQNIIADKKLELEKKKKEIEKKKNQLESLKKSLDGQKKAKETLLQVTKNDEVKYQKLLEAAKAKEQQLAQLIFKDGKVGYSMTIFGLNKQGSVSQGARIGTMGNSGYPKCSTAAHLHLESLEKGTIESTRIAGDLISPFSRLKPQGVAYFKEDNTIDVRTYGSGSWSWPLNDPTITQEFGKTPWSSRYLSGFHTGVDMVDYSNTTVSAVSSGTLYYAKVPCGNPINIAIIDHGGGLISTYLHLQ